ncbi:MAG: diadenylate cyclase, partial [Oscillospiraceae bacterium]|nr:diadenylate cyclase [Oscillospiraceae bacterium]
GSRHRAAVGISEVSDAITVVVSEETGTISVTCDGELIRGFTAETLKTYLQERLLVEVQPEDEQKSDKKQKRKQKHKKQKDLPIETEATEQTITEELASTDSEQTEE